MRLNRYLASCGLGSRRSVEELVEQRRVLLNGEEVTTLGTVVKPGDVVIVDGKKYISKDPATIILNKPRGVICSREDETGQGRPTLYDLLPPHLQTLHYVGRLDMDSQGLIIMTNSGELTDQLTHPRYEVEKEYLVMLDTTFDMERHAQALKDGMVIEGGYARAISVEQESPRVLAVTLAQGIKRQIRLMFDFLGYQVIQLERVRIGGLVAPDLKPGRWRTINQAEIDLLLQGHLKAAARPLRRRLDGKKPVGDAGPPTKEKTGAPTTGAEPEKKRSFLPPKLQNQGYHSSGPRSTAHRSMGSSGPRNMAPRPGGRGR
jgi:pseudouridine synthase